MDNHPEDDAYELDFWHIIQIIQEKLEGSGAGPGKGVGVGGEQRKAALKKVEIELDEADDIVSQLEIGLQGIPQSVKPPYAKLSKDLHAAAARGDLLSSSSSSRRALSPGSATSDDPYGRQEERNRLLKGTETLDDGSRRLQASTGLALEMVVHGAEILRSLREQIENSRNVLGQADTHIERASGTIQGVIRQMYKQRIMFSTIGVFAVVLILLVLYFKLVR